MAKDKNMQQASWEKKKDKLDKKKEKDRATYRTNEKVAKLRQKEDQEVRSKEVANRSHSIINMVRMVTALVVIVLYFVAMMVPTNQTGGITTVIAVTVLTFVCFGGSEWQAKREAAQEQQEVAGQIKGQLERKQTEKELEKQRAERRIQQQKEAKERLQRRAAEDKAALEQAKAIARAMRERRERREAEEAKERAKAAAQAKSEGDDGPADAHGWTAKQRQKLRDAAARYPESWSHAKKKRWEMIASEVDGHDARSCEATMARLEEEALAAAAAKAENKKQAQAHGQPANFHDFEDDFGSWDDDGTTVGTFDGGVDFGESDVDEEEEDEGRERMAVEAEPERKGTEIRLEGIKELKGCATVQVEVLHLQLSCADCRTTTQVHLSGADEDSADAKIWCEGCTGLISVRLRPGLLHEFNNRLCYVDCVRCNVTDVLPSVLTSTCTNCDAYNVHKQEFQRNRLNTGACFKCHEKYGFKAESIRIEQITPCDPGHATGRDKKGGKDDDADPMDEIAEELRYLRKKAKSDPRQQLIVLGRPLPQMGACSHFKKSYKWYRFACCGRAFPCPECHLESGCPAAALGAHAGRMICGKCSMEQSYSPCRPCEKCGFAMIAKGSSHWDDGGGTRNLAVMSTKDAKKFKGGMKQATSKTKTSSAKSSRVGVAAKKSREHAQKFGKD